MDRLVENNKNIVTIIVAIAVLSGITRIFSYKIGHYMLLSIVMLYLTYRLIYFIFVIAKYKRLDKKNKQHFAVFIALLIVVIFNNFNLLDAPFISLFFLMIDLLISIQAPKSDAVQE